MDINNIFILKSTVCVSSVGGFIESSLMNGIKWNTKIPADFQELNWIQSNII